MENIIISIGRQFGSGGRVIGKALAQKLNFDYYDKELLTLAAKENGISPEFFEQSDEKSFPLLEQASHWFENLGINNPFSSSVLSNDALFKMQSDTIKKLAEEKSFVILGRCSDYILRDNPNCISIFLHSTEEERAKRICKRMQITEEEAIIRMREEDKKRAAYYNFYSNKIWGDAKTYNLSIDISKLGETQTLEFILAYIKKRFPERF